MVTLIRLQQLRNRRGSSDPDRMELDLEQALAKLEEERAEVEKEVERRFYDVHFDSEPGGMETETCGQPLTLVECPTLVRVGVALLTALTLPWKQLTPLHPNFNDLRIADIPSCLAHPATASWEVGNGAMSDAPQDRHYLDADTRVRDIARLEEPTLGHSSEEVELGESQLEEILRATYLRSVLYPSGRLDAELERGQREISVDVLQQLRPLLSLMGYRAVHVFLFFSAFGMGLSFFWALLSTRELHLPAARHFRFSALELRDGSSVSSLKKHNHVPEQDILPVTLATFGVTSGRNWCPTKHGNLSRSADGQYMYVTYPQSVEANGWYTVSGQESEELDPTLFKLEAQQEDGEWRLIGAASWVFGGTQEGIRLMNDYRFDPPRARGAQTIVTYACSTACKVESLVMQAINCMAVTLSLVFALRKREKTAVFVLRSMFFLDGALSFATACMYVENHRTSLDQKAYFILRGFASFILWIFSDRSLERSFFVAGLLVLIGHCVRHGNQSLHTHVSQYDASPYEFMAYFFIAATLSASRLYRFMRVKGMVNSDRWIYEGVWVTVLQESSQGLAQVKELATAIERERKRTSIKWKQLKTGERLSMGNENKSPSWWLAMRGGTSNSINSSTEGRAQSGNGSLRLNEASCVDGSKTQLMNISGQFSSRSAQTASEVEEQLFSPSTSAGARELPSMFSKVLIRTRAAIEAAASDVSLVNLWLGKTAMMHESSHSLDQLYAQAEVVQLLLEDKVTHWAKICKGEVHKGKVKSVSSSVEKILRCYENDVARLTDLCRHSIVFETVGALALCMMTITGDREVQVLRCKNKMDPDFNALFSAGYRYVSLNVRIRNQDAVDLGLEYHVCEVLLLLSSMEKVKTKESHARYLLFRSVRGDFEFLANFRLLLRNLNPMNIAKKKTVNTVFPLDSADRPPRCSRRRRSHVIPVLKNTSVNIESMFEGSSPYASSPTYSNLRDGPMLSSAGDVFEDVSDDTRDIFVFRSWFTIATSFPGNFLDRKLALVEENIGDTGEDSAFFTSRPITAALRYNTWKILVMICAILWLGLGLLAFLSHLFSFGMRGTGSCLYSIPISAQPIPGHDSFFRFTTVRLRSDQQGEVASPNIDNLEVLQGGCPVLIDPSNVTVQGNTFTIAYSQPILADGLRFTTSVTQSPDDDPVRFVIEQAETFDDTVNGRWKVTASSAMTWSRSLELKPDARWVNVSDPWVVPTQRGAFTDVIFSLPLWPPLIYGAAPICAGMGMLAVAGISMLRWFKTSTLVLGMTWIVSGLLCLVTAIMMLAAGTVQLGVYWVLFSLVPISFGLILITLEWMFIFTIISSGVSLVMLDLIWQITIFGPNDGLAIFFQDPPVTGWVMFLFGMFAIYRRTRAFMYAKKMIKQDVDKYNALWQELKDKNSQGIQKIKQACSMLPRYPALYARQYNRKQNFPLSCKDGCINYENGTSITNLEAVTPGTCTVQTSPHWGTDAGYRCMGVKMASGGRHSRRLSVMNPMGLSPDKVVGRSIRRVLSNALSNSSSKADVPRPMHAAVDFNSRIRSLDQLYAQASGLDPVLRDKVRAWALASNGMFRAEIPGSNTTGFVRWQEASKDRALRASIRWGRLKGIDRSVEKLLRSYREDPSCLLDVCRQSIVFDSPEDLASCIVEIANDSEVCVVRLKNRLDLDWDSVHNAGYRDVSLGLRIQNDATARLGVDCHICEVLLLLKGFADIKNEDGHRRYISFRNVRGE